MLKPSGLRFHWFFPKPLNLDIPRVGLSLGLSAFALGQALQDGNGAFSLPAVIWLTVSLILLGSSLVIGHRPLPVVLQKISFLLLIPALLWQIYQLGTTIPGFYLSKVSISELWQFQLGVMIAGCFALLSLAPISGIHRAWQDLLVVLTLLAIGILGVWVIKASPSPEIDTFVFQQTSGEALLHRQNPYSLTPPNIYGHMDFYGEELVDNGKLTIGNPYPPLSIYFSTLGYLAGGDIRYSHLLAIILSGALIAFLHPGLEARLAAFLFLFTPRVFFVLEQSWTEPIVVFFMSVVIFCANRYPRWVPFMLGLLFASKQYFLFILPATLLLVPSGSYWRNWSSFYAKMGAVMVAVTAPLALWNLSAFLWNVGAAQWYQVFRIDALSYLALYARRTGQTPSSLFSFIALGIAFMLVWRFAPRTPTGFAIGVAWCLEVFFAFNKQAFCNYYFLVIGTICCALASLTATQRVSREESEISRQGMKKSAAEM